MKRFESVTALLSLIILCTLFSNSPFTLDTPPRPSTFTMIFRYGVGVKNILDTERGTYTKDMIIYPPITVNITLSDEELDLIWVTLVRNRFFELPETVTNPDRCSFTTPAVSYKITVRGTGFGETTIRWTDMRMNYNGVEWQMWRICSYIRKVIEAKPEVAALPRPRGGYL